MKKATLFLLMLISMTMFSQEFEYTASGFLNPENGESYIVLDFPNKTQQELYQAVLLAVNTNYRSPKDVLSENAPKSLTINALEKSSVKRNSMHIFDNNYSVTIQFKNGKMRINAPDARITTYDYSGRQEIVSQGNFGINKEYFGVYKKNGDLRIKNAKKDLDAFAQRMVDMLSNAVSKSSEDDW